MFALSRTGNPVPMCTSAASFAGRGRGKHGVRCSGLGECDRQLLYLHQIKSTTGGKAEDHNRAGNHGESATGVRHDC